METSKDYIFTTVREHKDDIYTKFNVKSPAMFGSVAKGTASTDSDIDISVSYTKTPEFSDFLKKRIFESIAGETC